jgi:hypothetical protein
MYSERVRWNRDVLRKMRHTTLFGGGVQKERRSLEGSQASLACHSDKSRMKLKALGCLSRRIFIF